MSEKDQFKRGMIVKNIETDKLGAVADDLLGCCSSNEIPVVYDGTNYFWGTDYRQLEIIGQENALADPKKCGAGSGEQCCIFLVFNSSGFECQRFGPLRNSLMFTAMKAKRHPNRLYPDCQLIAG